MSQLNGIWKEKKGMFKGSVKCEYNFTWNIAEFSEKFDHHESDTFVIYPMCNSSWKILINVFSEQILYLGMQRTDDGSHSVSVKSEFFLRNSKGTLFVKRDFTKMFTCGQEILFCDKKINKPTNKKGVMNDLGTQFRLCSDDELVVEGRIGIEPCCSQHNVSREQNSNQLLSALNTSMAENMFTDVEIAVDGDVLKAHKFMLAARSPVFRRMLETKMKEKTDNKIEITDADKSTFEMFLTFLYTGCIKDCNLSMIIQLYTLADKYDVQDLFKSCSSTLSSDMSETTVCNILSFAEVHNDKSLTEKAFQYICDNFELVECTEEWEKFVKENTLLAAKVVRKVASNISVRKLEES